ncbi:MAG TPA: hypothetical protein G4O07_00375 [Dehalococcoidia bacterium]|nr:hypothetical protein [Dehalococcoidia bacterium]
MTISKEISSLLDAIRDDRSHGAIELAHRAMAVLKKAAECSQADDADGFLQEQREIVRALKEARPSMAPIRNIAQRMIRIITERTVELEINSLRSFTMSTADEMVADSLRAIGKIAGNTLELTGNGTAIMTHSYSSTVVAALQQVASRRKNIRIVVTGSGSGEDGKETARQLGGYGVPVMLIDDAAAAAHITQAGMLVLGADTVCREGVVNAAGSYQLAVISAAAGVPVYVLCDTLKFDAELTRENVDLEYIKSPQVAGVSGLPPGVTACEYRFDFTPMKMVTGIITEEGILSSFDVAAYIKGLRDSLT